MVIIQKALNWNDLSDNDEICRIGLTIAVTCNYVIILSIYTIRFKFKHVFFESDTMRDFIYNNCWFIMCHIHCFNVNENENNNKQNKHKRSKSRNKIKRLKSKSKGKKQKQQRPRTTSTVINNQQHQPKMSLSASDYGINGLNQVSSRMSISRMTSTNGGKRERSKYDIDPDADRQKIINFLLEYDILDLNDSTEKNIYIKSNILSILSYRYQSLSLSIII